MTPYYDEGGVTNGRLREALAWWENAVYTELTETEENHVRELANAARRFLEPNHDDAATDLAIAELVLVMEERIEEGP